MKQIGVILSVAGLVLLCSMGIGVNVSHGVTTIDAYYLYESDPNSQQVREISDHDTAFAQTSIPESFYQKLPHSNVLQTEVYYHQMSEIDISYSATKIYLDIQNVLIDLAKATHTLVYIAGGYDSTPGTGSTISAKSSVNSQVSISGAENVAQSANPTLQLDTFHVWMPHGVAPTKGDFKTASAFNGIRPELAMTEYAQYDWDVWAMVAIKRDLMSYSGLYEDPDGYTVTIQEKTP